MDQFRNGLTLTGHFTIPFKIRSPRLGTKGLSNPTIHLFSVGIAVMGFLCYRVHQYMVPLVGS